MQRILVTGASGFTGGHLCERLAADGYSVRALVRPGRPLNGLVAAGVEPVVGDLRDPGSLRGALAGVDTVYHIAALYRDGKASRADLYAANLDGTKNLLDASIREGVGRFVHCSTIGVHGHIKHPPANEDAPFGPGDDYQRSKAEAEMLVRRHMEEGQIPITVFRPSGIYGPGDTRFLKLFKAIQQRQFVMIGKGRPFYHLVHISDLADGIILCGTRPEAVGQIYILGGPAYVTLQELVETIARIRGVELRGLRMPFWPVYAAATACEFLCKPLGLNPPLFRRRVDFFRKSRAFDISKARRELGYAPRVDLEEGLRRTAEWYEREGMLEGKPASLNSARRTAGLAGGSCTPALALCLHHLLGRANDGALAFESLMGPIC